MTYAPFLGGGWNGEKKNLKIRSRSPIGGLRLFILDKIKTAALSAGPKLRGHNDTASATTPPIGGGAPGPVGLVSYNGVLCRAGLKAAIVSPAPSDRTARRRGGGAT